MQWQTENVPDFVRNAPLSSIVVSPNGMFGAHCPSLNCRGAMSTVVLLCDTDVVVLQTKAWGFPSEVLVVPPITQKRQWTRTEVRKALLILFPIEP
jgi:hypothetical protein